jgi:hypothetical protein
MVQLANTRVWAGSILVSPSLFHEVGSSQSPPDLLLVPLEVTWLWSLVKEVGLVNQTRLIM